MTPLSGDAARGRFEQCNDLLSNSGERHHPAISPRSCPNFGTYYPNSEQHTWLTDLFDVKMDDAEVGGVKLWDWVTDIVNGKAPPHVGP